MVENNVVKKDFVKELLAPTLPSEADGNLKMNVSQRITMRMRQLERISKAKTFKYLYGGVVEHETVPGKIRIRQLSSNLDNNLSGTISYYRYVTDEKNNIKNVVTQGETSRGKLIDVSASPIDDAIVIEKIEFGKETVFEVKELKK